MATLPSSGSHVDSNAPPPGAVLYYVDPSGPHGPIRAAHLGVAAAPSPGPTDVHRCTAGSKLMQRLACRTCSGGGGGGPGSGGWGEGIVTVAFQWVQSRVTAPYVQSCVNTPGLGSALARTGWLADLNPECRVPVRIPALPAISNKGHGTPHDQKARDGLVWAVAVEGHREGGLLVLGGAARSHPRRAARRRARQPWPDVLALVARSHRLPIVLTRRDLNDPDGVNRVPQRIASTDQLGHHVVTQSTRGMC